jgi:Sugar-tranasporters, 12 TM
MARRTKARLNIPSSPQYAAHRLYHPAPFSMLLEPRHRFVSVLTRAPTDLCLLVLGLTQSCFEDSMYLFVFLWVPALQESAPPSSTLPLELIFSSFMISMMLGSILYTTIASCTSSSLLVHARPSSLVCGLGAVALATSVAYKEEYQRFWAFCLFEACVGMYYPVQGMLRGTVISNENRATVRGPSILTIANLSDNEPRSFFASH